jgi:S-adenosylmethionine:tRNA ribosyltransferase-isomerase
MMSDLTLSDFDFDLPPALIAQHPPAERGASRLLQVSADALADRTFSDLETRLAPGSVLVFNDTRVIKARLLGRKPSGGKVEVLVERITDDRHALALVRTSHAPREGALFLFDDGTQPATARVTGRQDDFFTLEFDRELLPLLERIGRVPLPPYIGHAPQADDEARYQTVYASEPGAVAAPTAGLHFTDDLLARLQQRGVQCARLTLHVGAGTFQPVRVERIAEHRMHSERYRIDADCAAAVNAARADGRPVIAVGTTSLRALEAAAAADGVIRAGSSETSIFITPGFRFRAVDRLITNFHLPRSTLLMLVSAFAGIERIRAAYAHAIAQRYRFFSYGDAMLLERAARAPSESAR